MDYRNAMGGRRGWGTPNNMGTVKRAGRQILRSVGGFNLARYVYRRSLRIVMYHRFLYDRQTQNHLLRQCRHFRECYQLVSLAQVSTALQQGRPLPDNALLVTVDDGYADFYEVAWPIFSSFKIPVG